MAGKIKTYFTCQCCGSRAPKWMGRCPDCGEWNTFVEEVSSGKGANKSARNQKRSAPVYFNDVESSEVHRDSTGIKEFDRVLGGGIVPGSFVLIGGDPGIGKSTLLLQLSLMLSNKKKTVLYVSGEESESQIRMRGDRLGRNDGPLFLLSETSYEEIVPHIESLEPKLIIIDSIQTVYTDQIQSAPGSVSQVRGVAAKLLEVAKSRGVTVFLIGHVTKEGVIAGPRVLEHMVDTVLYFEGDRGHSYRIVRAVKNRFGPANEIGVFEMKQGGLEEVGNPSELFLAERPKEASGSAVTAAVEGRRPVLLEIQALACQTLYGMPRRNVTGLDANRVSLLIAIIEKRGGMPLQSQDIFVNVAGGVNINEPCADLSVIAAIISSYRDQPISPETVIFGEVGLSGEVRAVPHVESRVAEARKLGFSKCIMPRQKTDWAAKPGLRLYGISTISELMNILF